MQTQFHSLPAQVAASLRDEMARGAITSLPGERELSKKLQVSRRTVRKALSILRADGVVKTGARHTVLLRPRGKRAGLQRGMQVNLLLPEPLSHSRPFTLLWIRALGDLMHKNGYVFEIVSDAKYYGARSGRSLAQLVKSKPASCWVLSHTNQPLQQWFNDHDVPAIVVGSLHPSITLPSLDTDHMALGHHMAGVFMRHGHSKVACFYEKTRHAGDIEAEDSFRAALARHAGAQQPMVVRIERTPENIIRGIKRVLAMQPRVTGFVFSRAFTYIMAQTYLSSLGYAVPRDFSMMAQGEDVFLNYIFPEPSRYAVNADKFAATLNRMVKRVISGQAERGWKIRIMPDFLPGASLASVGAPLLPQRSA